MPEEAEKVDVTEGMIAHYIGSGLEGRLREIYTACAADGWLNPGNIPRHLWQDGNLISEGKTYLHRALKLVPPAPVYDFATGKCVSPSEHYCEMVEVFTEEGLLRYVYGMLGTPAIGMDRRKDTGMVRYLLGRYTRAATEGVQPLDMLLFTVDEAAGECKRLAQVTDFEDAALKKAVAYRRKLEGMGKYGIRWRFPWPSS